MAFSSFKPCSRVVRTSPHQTDQQQREAHHQRLQYQEGHQQVEEEEEEGEEEGEGEAQRKVHYVPTVKHFREEASRLTSNTCHPPYQEDLPTFIAHQGVAPLKLQQKYGCKSEVGHVEFASYKKEQLRDDQLLRPLFQEHSRSQSYLRNSHVAKHMPKFRFLGWDSKNQRVDEDHHYKTYKMRTRHSKNACTNSNNMWDTAAHERATSVREELGLEKRRSSSASVEDMIRYREVVTCKERSYDGRYSWEEEVRQAMAKSLINQKQSEKANGLQRSLSVKDHGASVLPSTLLLKTTGGITSNAAFMNKGSKLHETDDHPLHKMNAVEKNMWRALNVKSPSEERWEEAAEVEEQQELHRKSRSQSMRYESSRSAELINGGGPWDACSSENSANHDDEWAVYKKSGYVNVRPVPGVRRGTFVDPVCCRSLLGRSLSMRDTRMGLVMECAACGAALHGAGGRLLCFCSCCTANRVSSAQEGMAATVKKKGGILRACRRLLGLSKKHPSGT